MLASLPVDCLVPAKRSVSGGRRKTAGNFDVHVEPTIRLGDEGAGEGAVLFGLEGSQLKTSGTPNPTKGVAGRILCACWNEAKGNKTLRLGNI